MVPHDNSLLFFILILAPDTTAMGGSPAPPSPGMRAQLTGNNMCIT